MSRSMLVGFMKKLTKSDYNSSSEANLIRIDSVKDGNSPKRNTLQFLFINGLIIPHVGAQEKGKGKKTAVLLFLTTKEKVLSGGLMG